MKISFSYKLILFLLMITFTLSAQQNKDTISYPRLSKFTIASIDNYRHSYSALNKSYLNTDVKMDEYRASVQIALPINSKIYFYHGWDYLKINSTTKDVIGDRYYNNCYESITCNIGFIQEFKNHWSLLFIVSPAIASDFKNKISNEDLMLGISAISYKRYNPYFEYGVGFSFNTRFKYEMYLPLLSLKYKKDKKEMSALLPLQLSAYYCLDKVKLGFEGRLFENYFNADDDLASSYSMDAFGFSKVNLGPKMYLQLYRSIYLNIAGGITVFNELGTLNKSGKKVEIVPTDHKFFFNFGLKILK